MVVNKIMERLNATKGDIAKFCTSDHQTADSMSMWRANNKELKRLQQLLSNVVTGLISAVESLHKLGFVSLNLHGEYQTSNLVMDLPRSLLSSEKFVCEVWL